MVSVEGRTVQLKELKSGGLLKIGTEDFMAGQWMLFKPKAGPQCLEDLTGMGAKAVLAKNLFQVGGCDDLA